MKTCLSTWQAIGVGAIRYLSLAGSISGAEIDVERLRETMRQQLQVAFFTKNRSEWVQS